MTPEQKEAYENLLRIINECEESSRIKGKIFSQANLNRYNEISLLCILLFAREPAKAIITVDEPTNEKSFVGISVCIDEFELNPDSKAKFMELINLADNVIFYGTDENYFDITFYVNDIWTEWVTTMEFNQNDEEILDALREEYNELKMQDRTFILDNTKAVLAKNICEQLTEILDDSRVSYTIDVEKPMLLTTHLCVAVTTNRFNPNKDKMNLYRNIINQIDEVAYITKDNKVVIKLYIADAYIQVE